MVAIKYSYQRFSEQILYAHYLSNLSFYIQQIVLHCFFMLYKNHIYIYFIHLSKIIFFFIVRPWILCRYHCLFFSKTLKVGIQYLCSKPSICPVQFYKSKGMHRRSYNCTKKVITLRFRCRIIKVWWRTCSLVSYRSELVKTTSQ